MDTLTALLQVPVNTLLILAGIVIVFFALFEVNKGSVKLRTGLSKNNFVPVGIGALLILGGVVLLYTTGAATPADSASVSIGITNLPAITPSETAAPTETPVIPTETVLPTDTPIIPTETGTPPPIKTISDGCIAVQTWQAKSIDADAASSISDQNNCWNLSRLGFVAQSDGTLHLLVAPSEVDVASGISTAVRDQSVIEFKVYVNDFYLVYNNKPAYITFSIAPQDDPMAARGSGRFKLQIKDTAGSRLIYFMLADTTESNGIELGTQHYLPGRTYKVRMELKGNSMEISINDVKLKETIIIPSGPKVFYIGYNVPVLASADIEIKDVIVDGVNQ